MQIKTLAIITALIFTVGELPAQTRADDIVGIWLTAGKEAAKIQIFKYEEKYYGKIVWLKNPTVKGSAKVDRNNPVKSKRTNPVLGLVLLNGFKFNGEDEWKEGNIYDPGSGKTYEAFMYLKDRNTLKLRGFIGISFFGRTETWTRAQ